MKKDLIWFHLILQKLTLVRLLKKKIITFVITISKLCYNLLEKLETQMVC
jgi:hypothetical protein